MKLTQFPARSLTTLLLLLMLGSFLPGRMAPNALAQENQQPQADWRQLAQDLDPLFKVLVGKTTRFSLAIDANVTIDDKPQSIQGSLQRYDDDSFDLELTHPDYAVVIRRRPDTTVLALPKHKTAFVGIGAIDTSDHLQPLGASTRLVSSGSQVAGYLQLLSAGDSVSTIRLLRTLVDFSYDSDQQSWTIDKGTTIKARRQGDQSLVELAGKGFQVQLTLDAAADPVIADDLPGFDVQSLDRNELERTLARGLRRTLEVLAPSDELTIPAQVPKTVEHGELRYVEGQRLVILSGTPQQVGQAHGELLQSESWRCIDSVLYAFGTVQTIVNGRWFRQDLEDALTRLQPHIPADHVAELHGLAQSLGMEPRLAEVINVFPELFHCSGFAVFGSATVDGKLYHGRVLDYMTTIGLQDCATTFIVSIDGKIPFANVGYAGFTGSVSGMNLRGISLGEMGGRGEGQWDGVPMATLMRRALEECDTLAEVRELWSSSPRTCEYYYVFADGKTNEAVGVAATPDKIEFIEPGQGHELLGPGIADSVVLSAGSRLETLRQRVTDWHGTIDAELGMKLMSRPVAMQSNLHNVLFIPEDGVFYVANADHQRPAAECRYVKFDLGKILGDGSNPVATRSSSSPEEQ